MSSNLKKLNWFARPPKLKKRMMFMLGGVCMMGFGLSLIRDINLGTDACSCFAQGLDNYLPFGFGTCLVLFHIVTLCFVLRFDVSKIGFGTLGNMLFLGYISDFFKWLWSVALPSDFFANTVTRYVLLVPSLAIFMVGAAAYMCSGLGASPFDALPFIISDHIKRLPFKVVRILWDLFFMIMGMILGGDFGIVTILSAFCLGPIISWVQKKLEVLI